MLFLCVCVGPFRVHTQTIRYESEFGELYFKWIRSWFYANALHRTLKWNHSREWNRWIAYRLTISISLPNHEGCDYTRTATTAVYVQKCDPRAQCHCRLAISFLLLLMKQEFILPIWLWRDREGALCRTTTTTLLLHTLKNVNVHFINSHAEAVAKCN